MSNSATPRKPEEDEPVLEDEGGGGVPAHELDRLLVDRRQSEQHDHEHQRDHEDGAMMTNARSCFLERIVHVRESGPGVPGCQHDEAMAKESRQVRDAGQAIQRHVDGVSQHRQRRSESHQGPQVRVCRRVIRASSPRGQLVEDRRPGHQGRSVGQNVANHGFSRCHRRGWLRGARPDRSARSVASEHRMRRYRRLAPGSAWRAARLRAPAPLGRRAVGA